MSADVAPTPEQIIRCWLWRLGLAVLLFFLALIAAFVIWRVRLSQKTSRSLAAIHAAGYPVSLAELEQKYYPIIASNENAALFFQSAFDLLQATNTGSNRLPEIPDYQSKSNAAFFPPEKLQRIHRFLTDNHDALGILHQSPIATNCRYPLNLKLGIGTLVPHLEPLRNSARLLALQAVLHAENGDITEAIDDSSAIFRLCHSLDNEPILISQLARMNMESLVITCLGHTLNSKQLTDAQLVYLSQAFDDSRKCPGMEHAMVTELCNGIGVFQSMGFTAPASGTNGNGAYAFNKLTGFFDRDFNFFLQTMSEALRLGSNTFPAKLDAGLALDQHVLQETSNHYYLVSSMILPSFGRASAKECSINARLKIIQTVLAIERFRLANQNHLPEKLSDLVPSFLPAVPIDPFDGKPIRYKKPVRGYLVYSIGEDRKDDGGVYAQPAQRLKPNAPSDITFVVER